MTAASQKPCDGAPVPPLYPIIDIDLCRMRGIDPRTLVTAVLAGGARMLQIRLKSGGSGPLLSLAREAVAAAKPYGARVIVNDRPDIASLAGAAGVHVGQADVPATIAQGIAGPDAIVGVSTHTPEQVDEALKGPARYIAVGPVFRTSTKETGYEPRGLELVRYAARTGKPVIGIGGISMDNAASVIEAGAAAVAVISDLLSDGAPDERVRAFLARIPAQPFNV